MRVDMLEFLKTGRFGAYVHGMRIEEIERLLGPLWDLGKGLKGIAWIHGSLAIWSYKGFVEGVFIQYKQEFSRRPFMIPDCIELVGPEFSGQTALKQFRSY